MVGWLFRGGGMGGNIVLEKSFDFAVRIVELSKYNDFLKAQHNRQRTILDKMRAVNHLLQVYQPSDVGCLKTLPISLIF